MNTKPSIKLIKREDLNRVKIRAKRELVASSTLWSSAVRSWVIAQRERPVEALPAFDSLFKDAF